jgi:hypothetical protein
MPQATSALRARWHGSMREPLAHLALAGWKVTADFEFRKPSPAYVPTADDLSAIEYLHQEWDYGGIEVSR